MARGTRAAAVLDTPRPSSAGIDPLGTIAADIEHNLSYSQILASNGVFRDPSVKSTGLARWATIASDQNVSRRGKATVAQKKYAVAMSAQEARDLTRDTGERHDWYDPGTDCPRCREPLVGWVLGGRKRVGEHDHVTLAPPETYRVVEIDTDDDDDETAEDDAPAAVGEA